MQQVNFEAPNQFPGIAELNTVHAAIALIRLAGGTSPYRSQIIETLLGI